MTDLSQERLERLFQEFKNQSILVVGDVMLDGYLWGNVSRISPEAPVPVVDIDSESHRFGGAANVCYNVHSLGANVIPVGVIGDDNEGQILKRLFEEKGFGGQGLIVDASRPTTVKTRVIANSQQVVRTDREVRTPIAITVHDRIMAYVMSQLDTVSAIILEDYNKGLLTPALIQSLIAAAKERDIPVLVDPKFDHFFEYRGVTLFKPNRKEAADKMGERIDTLAQVADVGQRLLSRLEADSVLITLGEEGMALIEPGKPMATIPTMARKVHDVSGAGDTVIATMAVVLSAGGTLPEAAVIANHAAGQVVAEVGIIPVEPVALLNTLLDEAAV